MMMMSLRLVSPQTARMMRPRPRILQCKVQPQMRYRERGVAHSRWICLSAKEISSDDLYFEEMSVQDLSLLLTKGNKEMQLVDVREPWEVELSSLPGFKTYPLQTLLSGELGDLEEDKTTIVLCHHGMRSRTASAFLKKEGFSLVYNVTGGIDAYASTVDPSVGKY